MLLVTLTADGIQMLNIDIPCNAYNKRQRRIQLGYNIICAMFWGEFFFYGIRP